MSLQNQVVQLRRQSGMTQKELARRADVSQSLIAKIETGRTQPTYQKAKQVLSVLQSEQCGRRTASDHMIRDVIAVKKTTPVQDIVGLMAEHDISQIPVIEEMPIGLVTESSLLHQKSRDDDLASEVMVEAPPTVSTTTPISAIRSLLQHTSIVLVTDETGVKGVVTKADLLHS